MCPEVEPLHVDIRTDVATANVAYDTRTMYARRAQDAPCAFPESPMPLEIVFLNTMEMLLPAIVITVLGLPLVRVIARRLDRRDTASLPALAKIEERLGRLEAGVDSIAVEVERISEGQRFTTRLLADRSESVASRPPTTSH